MTSPLKVMINARAMTAESVILFIRNLSQWLNITASCSGGFITIIA